MLFGLPNVAFITAYHVLGRDAILPTYCPSVLSSLGTHLLFTLFSLPLPLIPQILVTPQRLLYKLCKTKPRESSSSGNTFVYVAGILKQKHRRNKYLMW